MTGVLAGAATALYEVEYPYEGLAHGGCRTDGGAAGVDLPSGLMLTGRGRASGYATPQGLVTSNDRDILVNSQGNSDDCRDGMLGYTVQTQGGGWNPGGGMAWGEGCGAGRSAGCGDYRGEMYGDGYAWE